MSPSNFIDSLVRELAGVSSGSRLRLRGADPVVPSSFPVGTAAATALSASAMMAASLHGLRGGPAQELDVDLGDAVTEFRSERYLRLDGGPPPELWDPIAGAYRCGDDRYVRLHTNFPHHRDGLLGLLDCAPERDAVAAALARCEAAAFEDAASARGLVVAMMRSFAEWDRSPQGQALAGQPLVEMARLAEAPPRKRALGQRPLSGIKVVEMARIIAGPVCGRTLASHGAEVVRLIAPDLPTIEPLDMDMGHGKRSAYLDLRSTAGRRRLDALLAEADVFLHAYRPGALEAFGLDAASLCARHPGLVYASLSAYGSEGPWAGRRGFDSLVQTATGFNQAEAAAFGEERPRALPAQLLDHATGHFLAAGIVAALCRQMREGGSWQVRASLARTGLWLRSLGRVPAKPDMADLAHAAAPACLEEVDTPYGRLTRTCPAVQLSATPAFFAQPSTPYA